MDVLELLGRNKMLFNEDLRTFYSELSTKIKGSKILVIGGAGTIGHATTMELFKFEPKQIYVVDISENNLVELVRDIRSSLGYGSTEFKTFAIDCGSVEFEAFVESERYFDYIFNLSAMKHVRSEKDAYSLMRMQTVNILNTNKILKTAKRLGVKKYFCVSTDKSANPINMMGASKRIMEMFLTRPDVCIDVSMARFANVAFSDGSLLYSFDQRFAKQQPVVAPDDIWRYFITAREAGQLCLISAMLGEHRNIFFPKIENNLEPISLKDIAEKYVRSHGFEPFECSTESEARSKVEELKSVGKWPCYFSSTNTTGEKLIEEFYTETEAVSMGKFVSIGVIENTASQETELLNFFEKTIEDLRDSGQWTKHDILRLYSILLPKFDHIETGKFLDDKM